MIPPLTVSRLDNKNNNNNNNNDMPDVLNDAVIIPSDSTTINQSNDLDHISPFSSHLQYLEQFDLPITKKVLLQSIWNH